MSIRDIENKILQEVSADNLMKYAEYITAEDRESGSPGEKRAAEYFRTCMEEQGIETRINYIENYISLPEKGSVTLEDGRKLESCITHSYGASTGPEGLTGLAVAAGPDADVCGKIAVMHGLASAVPCKKLENSGAAGIICITSGNYPFNMSISPIWGQPVPETVGMISKIPVVTVNTPDGEILEKEMAEGRNRVTVYAEVSTRFRTVPVCIAEVKAGKPTDRFIMFGGHVDSWHKGGADNGGSNATVLELARVFQKYREYLNLNIRFCWWSGHSNGRYSGSNWYADTHWEDIHDNAVLNVDIDTIGTKGSNNFEHIECNKQCYTLGKEVVSERVGQVPEYFRIQRNGDQSFWAQGVPTLFECLSLQPTTGQGKGTFMPGLPWYWHTTEDKFEHLGREELLRDARIVALALTRAACLPVCPFAFVPLAEEMKENLIHYSEVSGKRLDLSKEMSLVKELEGKFEKLDERILSLNGRESLTPEETSEAAALNDLCMKLNRTLIPVHYCKNGDLFQVDLAIPIPPFPEFEDAGKLAEMDPDSNEFKFLERQIFRNRSRVHYYLREAAALLKDF